jgi:hypothetical protein
MKISSYLWFWQELLKDFCVQNSVLHSKLFRIMFKILGYHRCNYSVISTSRFLSSVFPSIAMM